MLTSEGKNATSDQVRVYVDELRFLQAEVSEKLSVLFEISSVFHSHSLKSWVLGQVLLENYPIRFEETALTQEKG